MTTAVYPDLAGKVAVVTGGSRGIGAATCQAFAANKMKVAAVGRDVTALDKVREQIWDAGGMAIGVPADCTDPAALAGLRERVGRELGEVDVLAVFAGGAGAPVSTVELSAQRWREVLDTDLTSAFLTAQAFLPGMLARGSGTILTMASAAGRQPSRANAAYAVAKAGVVMLTRHLAAELAGTGVRVNCIAPSAVLNEKMERNMTAEQRAQLGAAFPLGRIGQPEDVAAAALYLASDASSWVTGVTLDVAGGKFMP
ncbi:MAG TPA: SDR family NAD(P)-dependent oxidoreductase [Rugosimonospora sp.]|nr:SDR family NAD(P)-dependent oxidoreductase [Rugosimonospora sp.]